MKTDNPAFGNFIDKMTELISSAKLEAEIVAEGKCLLAELVSTHSWLPENYRQASSQSYQQFLLYCDPEERFSVVSFVWGPHQTSSIHNHTVWGLVGMLEGVETCDEFELKDGMPRYSGVSHQLLPGQVDAVSPAIGDWHRIKNDTDAASISIHVYGANIGKVRRTRLGEGNRLEDFVSGYSNQADL